MITACKKKKKKRKVISVKIGDVDHLDPQPLPLTIVKKQQKCGEEAGQFSGGRKRGGGGGGGGNSAFTY